MCSVTFVTAYFQFPSKHTYTEYDAWIQNLLQTDMCLVVYTDMPDKFPSNTIVKTVSLYEEIYQAFKQPISFWEKQLLQDPENHIHKNFTLYWVWNLKPIFLEQTSRENPHGSDYFMWIDAGCIRSHDRTLTDFQWSTMKLPERVVSQGDRLLVTLIDNFQPGENSNSSFLTVDRIAGTVFGGNALAVRRWKDAYTTVFSEYMIHKKFLGKDQSLMATACLQFEHLCYFVVPHLLYGNPWTSVLLFLQNTPDWEQFLTFYSPFMH